MTDLKDFNSFISQKVTLLSKDFYTQERIASYLNVSESFIKKVNSNSCNEHFNIYHLWKISKLLKTPIDDFMPPSSNFEEYVKVLPYANKKDFEIFKKKYNSKEE